MPIFKIEMMATSDIIEKQVSETAMHTAHLPLSFSFPGHSFCTNAYKCCFRKTWSEVLNSFTVYWLLLLPMQTERTFLPIMHAETKL